MRRCLFASLLIVVASSTASRAQETTVADDAAARIARLEAQVAELQARPAPVAPSEAFRPHLWDLYGGGWYGGAEATILEPFMSGAPSVFGTAPVPGSLIQQQFLAGVRYQVGWANEAGLGVRGRYWSYFNYFGYAEPYAPARLGIELQAADLEATVTQRVWNWDTVLAAGARYGRLNYVNPTAGIFGVGNAAFDGVGPTLALEGRRRLGSSGFSLYGNARGSLLFGTITNQSIFTFMPRSTIYGEVMGVAENQLGIAWDWVADGGLVIEARAVWETQYWMNNTLSNDAYGIGTNLGLMGPTVGLQICF